MPGMGELIVILLIVLVVFGANKLPGIGDALGRSIKNFKSASSVEDEHEDVEAVASRSPAKSRQADRAARGVRGGRRRRVGRGRRRRRKKKPASASES